MRPLQQRLSEAGYQVHNLGYASTRSAPEKLVGQVGEAVERRCSGASKLHFVTHSLGGILARAYLSREPSQRAGRVVMLAPPNRGSEVVDRLGNLIRLLGPTAQELGTAPDSLPNRLPSPDFELGVIAGTGSLHPFADGVLEGAHDGTVRVESTRLEGMSDFLALPVSHTFIMRSPEVARQVLCFLRTGRFDREPDRL